MREKKEQLKHDVYMIGKLRDVTIVKSNKQREINIDFATKIQESTKIQVSR